MIMFSLYFFVSGGSNIAINQLFKPFVKNLFVPKKFKKDVLVYCSRYTRGDSLCAG